MKWMIEFQTSDGEWHRSSVEYNFDPYVKAYNCQRSTGMPYRTVKIDD